MNEGEQEYFMRGAAQRLTALKVPPARAMDVMDDLMQYAKRRQMAKKHEGGTDNPVASSPAHPIQKSITPMPQTAI